jgi:peroxiredoxin
LVSSGLRRGDPALDGSDDAAQAGSADRKLAGSGRGLGDSKVAAGAGRGVGDPAPAFSAAALDGTQFGNKGPVVMVFLSPWCESYLEKSRAAMSARCRDVRAQVEELARQHPETRWLGVASGLWASPEDLNAYVTKYKVTIPLTLDESGALFNSFQVRNVPTVIAINGHGVIEQRIEGSDSALAADLSRVALVR